MNRGGPMRNCRRNGPRRVSPDTKFCYYNNCSLSQPPYFCKACQRQWTRGGSLRNIPVGGGARKKRRAKLFKPGLTSTRTQQIQDKGTELGHGSSSSSSGSAAGSQASSIDLSEIYAKYLNPTSKLQNNDEGQSITSEPVTEETISTQTDHLLLGELDNFRVDGANNYFFDMSCTDDSTLGWRGHPNDGLGTPSELNSLIYYENAVIGIEGINDYEQASFIESYVPSFTCN